MRYIEADGEKFAHVSEAGEMRALCGKRPFPWDWHQPVKRTKKVCAGCLKALRR